LGVASSFTCSAIWAAILPQSEIACTDDLWQSALPEFIQAGRIICRLKSLENFFAKFYYNGHNGQLLRLVWLLGQLLRILGQLPSPDVLLLPCVCLLLLGFLLLCVLLLDRVAFRPVSF